MVALQVSNPLAVVAVRYLASWPQTCARRGLLQCQPTQIGEEPGEKLMAILKTPLMLRGRFGNVSGKWNQSLFQSHVREDLAFDEADYPNSAVLLDGGYGPPDASNRSHAFVSGSPTGWAGPRRAGLLAARQRRVHRVASRACAHHCDTRCGSFAVE